MTRVLILGTGLIGASLGLALKSLEATDGELFEILGWDSHAAELEAAVKMHAIDRALSSREAALQPDIADIYVLATPVLPILDWMERLAPVLDEHQLVTDVGSTKREIAALAQRLYNAPHRARFLPGHPMAGKESGGAALAEATLFRNAAWLFTPVDDRASAFEQHALEQNWTRWITSLGARVLTLDAARHDELCAWVSHLPQMLSTALAALLEDHFAADPEGRAIVDSIGGRALRETTRLGASPYSMWRDVAMTNTAPLAETLLALEQRLQYLRENLRTPALRDEFSAANRFKAGNRE